MATTTPGENPWHFGDSFTEEVLDELRHLFQFPKALEFMRSGLPLLKEKLNADRANYVEFEIPVSCLRWSQDKVHSQMIFRGGNSLWEVTHDYVTYTRVLCDPLDVVLIGGRLYSLSNRRLLALKAANGVLGNEEVVVKCHVYSSSYPKLKQQFKSRIPFLTIATHDESLGLSVRVTKRSKAMHYGQPLFRTPAEWCAPSSMISTDDESEIEDSEEEGVPNPITGTTTPGRAAPPPGLPEPYTVASLELEPTMASPKPTRDPEDSAQPGAQPAGECQAGALAAQPGAQPAAPEQAQPAFQGRRWAGKAQAKADAADKAKATTAELEPGERGQGRTAPATEASQPTSEVNAETPPAPEATATVPAATTTATKIATLTTAEPEAQTHPAAATPTAMAAASAAAAAREAQSHPSSEAKVPNTANPRTVEPFPWNLDVATVPMTTRTRILKELKGRQTPANLELNEGVTLSVMDLLWKEVSTRLCLADPVGGQRAYMPDPSAAEALLDSWCFEHGSEAMKQMLAKEKAAVSKTIKVKGPVLVFWPFFEAPCRWSFLVFVRTVPPGASKSAASGSWSVDYFDLSQREAGHASGQVELLLQLLQGVSQGAFPTDLSEGSSLAASSCKGAGMSSTDPHLSGFLCLHWMEQVIRAFRGEELCQGPSIHWRLAALNQWLHWIKSSAALPPPPSKPPPPPMPSQTLPQEWPALISTRSTTVPASTPKSTTLSMLTSTPKVKAPPPPKQPPKHPPKQPSSAPVANAGSVSVSSSTPAASSSPPPAPPPPVPPPRSSPNLSLPAAPSLWFSKAPPSKISEESDFELRTGTSSAGASAETMPATSQEQPPPPNRVGGPLEEGEEAGEVQSEDGDDGIEEEEEAQESDEEDEGGGRRDLLRGRHAGPTGYNPDDVDDQSGAGDEEEVEPQVFERISGEIFEEEAPVLSLFAEQATSGLTWQAIRSTGILVGGIFRCLGCQKKSICGEVLVEQGPDVLLGRYVNVKGIANRLTTWHQDRVWVRITVAKDQTGRGLPEGVLSEQLARRLSLFGQVVWAEGSGAFGAPRQPTGRQQTYLTCRRHRRVFDPSKLRFTAINGKFPRITVKWERPDDLPDPDDFHLLRIDYWDVTKGLFAKYVQPLRSYAWTEDHEILNSLCCSFDYGPSLTGQRGGAWKDHLSKLTVPDSVERPLRKLWTATQQQTSCVVALRQQGDPVTLAFSFRDDAQGHPQLLVHISDVDEWLSKAPRHSDASNPNSSLVEEVGLERCVGSYLVDHQERPLESGVTLPLLPDDWQEKASFSKGKVSPVVTFYFPLVFGRGAHTSGYYGRPTLKGSYHKQERIQVSEVIGVDELSAFLTESRDLGGVAPTREPNRYASESLKRLFDVVQEFEAHLVADESPFIFHDLDPNFALPRYQGSTLDERANPMLNRVVKTCHLLTNRYAGRRLLSLQCQTKPKATARRVPGEIFNFPVFQKAKADQARRIGMGRLLMDVPLVMTDEPITVGRLGKVLKAITGKPDLSYKHLHSLQAAFMRELRNVLPPSVYRLRETGNWQLDTEADANLGRPEEWGRGDDVFTTPATFPVAEPLKRYMDILGLRALKSLPPGIDEKPTGPANLRLPKDVLERLIRQTNSDRATAENVRYTFHQLKRNDQIGAQGGLVVDDAIVGSVSTVALSILVPSFTMCPWAFQLPTNAMSSSSFESEVSIYEQNLSWYFSCLVERGNSKSNWRFCSWQRGLLAAGEQDSSQAKLSCIVALNPAMPFRHHATPSARMITELTLSCPEGRHKRKDVVIPIAHRIHSEVFSEFPNLDDYYRMWDDIDVYSRMWTRLERCRLHADAVKENVSMSANIGSAKFYPGPGGQQCDWHVECIGGKREYHSEDISPLREGDLVILRLRAPVVLDFYGTFLLSPELPELVNTGKVRYRLQLSEISLRIWKNHQTLLEQHFLEASSEFGPTYCCNHLTGSLYFMNIDLSSLSFLRFLETIPRLSREDSAPMGSYLLASRPADAVEEEQHDRVLMERKRVDRTLGPLLVEVRGNDQLNNRQITALEQGLQRKVSLVQGPPGTGKTTFLVHLVAGLVNAPTPEGFGRENAAPAARDSGRILICTPSNAACDHMLIGLLKRCNFPPKEITRVYSRTIEAAQGYRDAPQRKETTVDIPHHLRTYALHVKARESRKDEAEILKQSRIIITTCGSAINHPAFGGRKTRGTGVDFETVIIDEAAQATEPEVVAVGFYATRRVVVVGDHKQLAPVISEYSIPSDYRSILSVSYLERAFTTMKWAPRTMLVQQYRMPPSISKISSSQFYENRLRDAPRTRRVETTADPLFRALWGQKVDRVVWVDCQTPQSKGKLVEDGVRQYGRQVIMANTTSWRNLGEAKVVVGIANKLLSEDWCKPDELAIITPYRAQQKEIRDRLANAQPSAYQKVSIGTVHGLQGSERPYIILSFVRSTSEDCTQVQPPAPGDVPNEEDLDRLEIRQILAANLGIVDDEKLLNVSITRAQRGLICVGHRALLAGSDHFHEMTKGLMKRGCVLPSEGFFDRFGLRNPIIGV